MEIEKPKVQNGNEPNKPTELMLLIDAVFDKTPAGKKVLTALKDIYVSNKNTALVWPANVEAVLKQFGSVEVYSGFKAGQAGVIFWIESMIEAVKNMGTKQENTQGGK